MQLLVQRHIFVEFLLQQGHWVEDPLPGLVYEEIHSGFADEELQVVFLGRGRKGQRGVEFEELDEPLLGDELAVDTHVVVFEELFVVFRGIQFFEFEDELQFGGENCFVSLVDFEEGLQHDEIGSVDVQLVENHPAQILRLEVVYRLDLLLMKLSLLLGLALNLLNLELQISCLSQQLLLLKLQLTLQFERILSEVLVDLLGEVEVVIRLGEVSIVLQEEFGEFFAFVLVGLEETVVLGESRPQLDQILLQFLLGLLQIFFKKEFFFFVFMKRGDFFDHEVLQVSRLVLYLQSETLSPIIDQGIEFLLVFLAVEFKHRPHDSQLVFLGFLEK